jgi:hypothetical protein
MPISIVVYNITMSNDAHTQAIQKLLTTFSDWKQGLCLSPLIIRHCKKLGHRVEQPFPEKVHHVQPEFIYNFEGQRIIADIALFSVNNEVLAIIEIVHTHPIDVKKIAKIKSLPCIELKATDVLDNPMRLEPVREFNLRPPKCQICTHAEKFKVIYHGMAAHIMQCPLKKRTWRGHTYANMIDDCSDCPHLAGQYRDIVYEREGDEEYPVEGDAYIFCTARFDKRSTGI